MIQGKSHTYTTKEAILFVGKEFSLKKITGCNNIYRNNASYAFCTEGRVEN